MASELTISQILSIAKVCQYLNTVRTAVNNALKGGDISEDRARLIYMERIGIQNRYNLNPNDPTLPGTANYLFSILRYQSDAQNILNSIAGGLATISNPANVSINVGQNATFSVVVTSASPYVVQWFRNSVAIPGATGLSYTLTNAQLSDTASTFFAVATNASGPISSGVATLTVTAVLTGFFSYQSIDPAATLQANSDPFTYQESFSITNGQPWVMPVPGASTPNMYIIVKGPVGQPIKTAWNNQGVNSGFIPDLNWHPTLAFGGFQYYYSHLLSLDPLQTLTLS